MKEEKNNPWAFSRRVFCDGMREGFPIALGYFAVSFSLGIAARQCTAAAGGQCAEPGLQLSAGRVGNVRRCPHDPADGAHLGRSGGAVPGFGDLLRAGVCD